MIRWWFFEEPLMKLRIFGCKHFWSLKFLMCWSSNFGVSLQLEWLIVVDDSLNKRWWDLDDFDAKIIDENSFVVEFSETLMFHCCFLDDSLMNIWGHIWNIVNFDGNFFDLYCYCGVFFWIINVSLLLHWWVVDDPLKKPWWHYEDFDANAKDHWSF